MGEPLRSGAPSRAMRLRERRVPLLALLRSNTSMLGRPLSEGDQGQPGEERGGRRRRPRPPANRWVIFSVASIALFMSSVDSTIVATGLPAIRHALHTHLNWVSWTMTAYQLGLVTCMPIAGRIADISGRKKVFVLAAGLFTAASLLCGLTSNIFELVVLRALQAVGGAAFMPSASGMVIDAFGKDRNRAIGLFSSVFPLGSIAGPIFGGVIISTWSWRGLFMVNVPVGLVFTVLAVRYLPSSPPRTGRRADVSGSALMGGAVLALMLAVSDAGNPSSGLLSPLVVGPALLAAGLGAMWLWRSSRVADPVIPLRLLRGRAFASMNTVNFVWGACVIGLGALLPLVGEEAYGLTPLRAGTLLTAWAASEIGVAVVAALLLHRTGYRLPMLVGFGLVAAGLVIAGVHPVGLPTYLWLLVAAALAGVGTGISAPAANNATLELAPEDIGAIVGVRVALRQSGAIVAVAVTTAVATQSASEAAALLRAYLVIGLLLVLIGPLVLAVPDNGRRRPARTTPTAKG